MTRAIPQIALDFTEKAEGRPAAVYLDAGGRPTGGHGHLLTPAEIKAFPVGAPIDDEQDAAWLAADYQDAANKLAVVVNDPIIEGLTDHEYAALLDFVFNVGAGSGWEIWKDLNQSMLDQVPGQLIRFDKVKHANGVVEELQGLKNRRLAETALWNAPDLATACGIAAACPVENPSSYSREAITPPTPAAPKPYSLQSITTKGAGLASTVGAGAIAVQQQIEPHASVAPIFHTALVAAISVGIGCGVLGLAIHYLQQKQAAA